MNSDTSITSPLTRVGLRIQGYTQFSDAQLASFAPGIRFAYGACGLLVFIGLMLHQPIYYYAALAIALGGMFPPRHPMDYVYNGIIRHWLGKPSIPNRPPQSRFACSLAAIWLTLTLVILEGGYESVSGAFAGALIMQVGIVTFVDVCFPSMIYNFLTCTSIDSDEPGKLHT
jgi:Domain of unknown function (DUF4395)